MNIQFGSSYFICCVANKNVKRYTNQTKQPRNILKPNTFPEKVSGLLAASTTYTGEAAYLFNNSNLQCIALKTCKLYMKKKESKRQIE
jgi:hypothetical protein